MNIIDLSASQLSQAASIKQQIEKLQEELASLLETGAAAAPAAIPSATNVSAAPKKRTMSVAARNLLELGWRNI